MVSDTITRTSASIFVGPELSQNLKLTTSFRTLAIDVGPHLQPSGILRFFPSARIFFQRLYFYCFSPTIGHKRTIREIVIPIVRRRREEKLKLGDAWERPVCRWFWTESEGE